MLMDLFLCSQKGCGEAGVGGGAGAKMNTQTCVQRPGFVGGTVQARARQAVLSRALERLLPVKFINHNLFPLHSHLFSNKKKASHCTSLN